MKKSGPAAPQGVTVCALRHPSLPDQLLSDYGNRAPLQPGMSRQIGSRDWLMSANQVQHDAPVNVACRFASRNLEIGEIYLSHFGIEPAPSNFYFGFLKVTSGNRTVSRNQFVRGVN